MIFEVDPQLDKQSTLDFFGEFYAKHKCHGLSLSVNSYCPDKESNTSFEERFIKTTVR